ncbi:MAG TPA: hypothetical protein VFC78_13260 [Tepidisphaeraceae bacterium]|nr:hypothetical protein [Tepidisphaeraceae bacterium]
MKTTLDLPNELIKEVKLLAVHEGKKLKDAVADLLRRGLDASTVSATVVKANKEMLKCRKEMTRKFVSGEWGVELAGLEEARKLASTTANELNTPPIPPPFHSLNVR